jgi:hypothetical protein
MQEMILNQQSANKASTKNNFNSQEIVLSLPIV